jgi:hypothetical protein
VPPLAAPAAAGSASLKKDGDGFKTELDIFSWLG